MDATFQDIGNTISTYLAHDSSYLISGILIMARILVNVGLRDGLPEEIYLRGGEGFM